MLSPEAGTALTEAAMQVDKIQKSDVVKDEDSRAVIWAVGMFVIAIVRAILIQSGANAAARR